MTGTKRPRGRRALLRGIGLALLALVAPGSATAAQIGQVDRFPAGAAVGRLTPGVDGGLWTLTTPGAARVAADGVVTTFAGPADGALPRDQLAPLADGSLAALTSDGGIELLGPAGALATRPLPTPRGDAAAIAADGTVWQASVCRNGGQPPQIRRVAPSGAVVRFPLARLACPQNGGYGRWTAGAAGEDGSFTIANDCQGRRARVTVDGRLRQWRSGPTIQHCNEDALDASPPRMGPDAVTPDGSGWTVGQGVVQRTPDGRRRTYTEFGTNRTAMANAVAGADGNLWLTAGFIHAGRGYWEAEDVQIVQITPAGEIAMTPLVDDPHAGTAQRFSLSAAPTLAAGPDAPVWVGYFAASGTTSRGQLARVSSATPLPAPVARASATRLVARSGASTWVQVACHARPGRYCRGAVRLERAGGGAISRAAAAFTIPGGGRRTVAVRLRLTPAERSRLRQGRGLRLTAIATVAGGARDSRRIVVR